MRHFTPYLFENFDPEAEANNPANPRNFLNPTTDPILSEIAQHPPLACPADAFPGETLAPLLSGGILRMENGRLAFDTPIFLREDAPVLRRSMTEKTATLVSLLRPALPKIQSACRSIENGFPAEENLYHILCGMIFDGLFFDYLTQSNALATSRSHPSGLDYLAVIYEDCPELNAFSDNLLCSYNRFTNGSVSLQTFGDANGNRFDFYRFSRLREQGKLPPQSFSLWPTELTKDHILSQTRLLFCEGHCDSAVLSLLTRFGYAKDGTLCIPVFTSAHDAAILEIETLVETTIGEAFTHALSTLPAITAARHGVNKAEIANELYHILFGSVNEALASGGIVTAPSHIPGEGRYRRCIELDI